MDDRIARLGNPVLFPAAATGPARGWFVPHPVWCGRNLETVPTAVGDSRTIMLHKRAVVPYYEAMRAFRGWRPKQIYGWSPRHKMLNPKRALSNHAFGIAIDMDWEDNPYGAEGTTIPEWVLAAMTREGWLWGGHWKVPDSMHFELPLHKI